MNQTIFIISWLFKEKVNKWKETRKDNRNLKPNYLTDCNKLTKQICTYIYGWYILLLPNNDNF